MVDQIKMFKHTYQNVECYKLLKQVQILFIFNIYVHSGVHTKDINKLAG